MNFRTRVKHINKSLTKYSRLLFVAFSVVGIILSFFISDINRFQFTQADTLVGTGVGGVATNGVKSIHTLKDGSDRFVTLTNQWSSSYFQINSHYNPSDYNQYNVCDTGIDYGLSNNAVTVDDDGNVYILDAMLNNLNVYPFDSCSPSTYLISNVTLSDEDITGLVLDSSSGDLYATQETIMVRLPISDYGNAETYSFTNGRTYPNSLTFNEINNSPYVLFGDGYVQQFNGNDSFNVTEYDISSVSDCSEKIVYRSNSFYISDNCDYNIYQYNGAFSLQQTYVNPGYITDFTVNDDYIFAVQYDNLIKFNIGYPADTQSNILTDVSFMSVDYMGNNTMVFSSYYRDFYKFTLTISGGAVCPVDSPPYVQNGNRCERWIYSFDVANASAFDSVESVFTNKGMMVLRKDYMGGGGIYNDFNGVFDEFPSGYLYAETMVASLDGNYLYILFEEDDNIGGGQSILIYDIENSVFDGALPLPNGQEFAVDMVMDFDGNIVTINSDGPGLTSLTLFPFGDYLNPVTIDPDFNFSSYDYPLLGVDEDNNLYAVAESELRVIDYDSGNYSTSASRDISQDDLYNPNDILVKNSSPGVTDLYISGADSTVTSTVLKLPDIDLNADINGTLINYTSTYGAYSSYEFTSIAVDNYGNVFAIPPGSTNQIALFTADGTEHAFDLDVADSFLTDLAIDDANDLYVTSENIDFQQYEHDYQPAQVSDACITDTPPYIENYTRCERYLNNTGLNNNTTVEVGEAFTETVMDNGIFFAATDSSRLYAGNNYYPLPNDYSGIYALTADKNYGTDGVYFLTTGPGGYTFVMHFDYDSQNFDYAYDTQTSFSGSVDFAVRNNGDVFVISQSFNNTMMIEFQSGIYNSGNLVSKNFDFPGTCSARIRIVNSGDAILQCGNNVYGLLAADFANIAYSMDLTGYNFDTFITPTDIFIEERYDDNVDLYISGSNSSSNGIVHQFVGLNTETGSIILDNEFTDAIFTGLPITDIYIQNNSGIFASSDFLNTQLVWFNTQGNSQVLDVDDVGSIVDILLDNDYNLYVTSSTFLYQFLEFDYIPLNTAGSMACVAGGDLDLTTVTAGNAIHTNAWIDGNPDNPPPYPTGYVEIRANGLPISEALLDGVANASHDFTILNPGTYTVTIYYSGDENYAGCNGTLGTIDVTSAAGGYLDSQTTITSVTPNPYGQVTGEDVVITVSVSDPNNPSEVPTGDVELRHDICCSGDYNVLATATLDGNGEVTFTLRDLYPGGYTIHAEYLGDNNYTTSASIGYYQVIYAIQTFTTLQSSDVSVVKGDQITLSAHVSLPNFTVGPNSPVELTGWVRFRIGGSEIGWDQVDANGDAEITINTSDDPVQPFNIDEGVHHIRAYYEPRHDLINFWMRPSQSETLFQTVAETDNTGGGNTGSDIPPSGGEGGNSDFSATIVGKDKATGSLTQTKIGSILSWVMSHNNLGPNSNQAVTYFPIRENQDFVIGSVVAPSGWTITYTQDQSCDDSTFNYTPVGSNGQTDPLVRCVRFENDRVNVPPTRSNIRYITTTTNFTELNVGALGGRDVYEVVPYNNKLFYFNHHWLVDRSMADPLKTMFCFDLEINDTCVSKNPAIVYPVVMGQDGFSDIDDEYISSKTSFAVNAEIVNDKMYIPMTDVNFKDGVGNGHGFLCWDLLLDFYCSSTAYIKQGMIVLGNVALNAWGWGNIGDVEYNPDMQEIYSINVGDNNGYMQLLCYSIANNAPCVGQPYQMGTIQGYDPGWSVTKYQHSTGRIYSTSGGNSGYLDRQLQCMIAATKQICSDFPNEGIQVLPDKPNQSVFINQQDEMCVFIYSDGGGVVTATSPRIFCYDLDSESFYDYLPILATSHFTNDMFHDFEGPYPDGRIYFMSKWTETIIQCYEIESNSECPGWEGGKTAYQPPFDDQIYSMTYAFGCMWAASDSGRVFTFDEDTGEYCNPLITLSEGSVAVTLDANDMFCATDPDDISWNKVKVLDSGTSPSPALLGTSVYDSSQCSTDENNVITCTGTPLKSGNLLLNSGHELDISDIDYNSHKSLTAILEFQYPSVPTPAPGFYIELNPTNKAQMCAETKLMFTGALCANPITTVCENTNISYVNDPVSNNNGGQYCLNVETYFGKDANSSLCFVAATPQQRIFTVFNPNATVSTGSPTDFNPEETYNRGSESYSFGNGFFGFVQNIIETTIPQIINQDTVKNAVQSFGTQTPFAVTAVTAVTTATVVATSVVTAGSGIGQIFGVLLGFFSPRKRKYWGIIFDDLTNKPVAFASITLSIKEIGKDNQMKSTVITQAVSDLDGRYRLNTDQRDKFYLEVKASGYQPYTKFISMANPLNSAEDIVYDIPLRRIDAKESMFKSLFSYKKKGFINFARAVLLFTSIIGFLFTIYSQINFPDNLNLILLVVYVLIFIISFYPSIYTRIQKRGKVIDVDFNSPIPGAVVRIYDTKQQIALSLTNSKGEARFDLPAGEYSILASKRGYIMVAEPGKQLIKAILKAEGYLDQNILLKRIEESPTQSTGGLDNPFS